MLNMQKYFLKFIFLNFFYRNYKLMEIYFL